MIYNNVREIRKAKGISCSALARASGVPLRTLQDWEYGNRIATSAYQLRKVARVLGVQIEDLLSEEDPE